MAATRSKCQWLFSAQLAMCDKQAAEKWIVDIVSFESSCQLQRLPHAVRTCPPVSQYWNRAAPIRRWKWRTRRWWSRLLRERLRKMAGALLVVTMLPGKWVVHLQDTLVISGFLPYCCYFLDLLFPTCRLPHFLDSLFLISLPHFFEISHFLDSPFTGPFLYFLHCALSFSDNLSFPYWYTRFPPVIFLVNFLVHFLLKNAGSPTLENFLDPPLESYSISLVHRAISC